MPAQDAEPFTPPPGWAKPAQPIILAGMSRSTATVLQRLRLHKGAWALMLLAAFIKLASSTACFMDMPRLAVAPDDIRAVTTTLAATPDDTGDSCVLGEGGGCHCACAHMTPLPAGTPALAVAHSLPSPMVHPPSAPASRAPASLLRPPIA
jgi:hypothetical protein